MPHEGTLYLEMETKWHPLYKALPLELKNKNKEKVGAQKFKMCSDSNLLNCTVLIFIFFKYPQL